MRRLLRWVLISLGGLVALVLVAFCVLYLLGSRELSARRVVAAEKELVIPIDSASIARGARLIGARPCGQCHGEDLGGNVIADNKLFGRISAPNLTRGRGGRTPPRTDLEWEQAIRHGVRREGTSLFIMPSEVFHFIADDEMAAIIAYLKQLRPVDRDVPPIRTGPLAHILIATRQVPVAASKAPSTPHVASVDTTPGLEYGKYLVSSSGCRMCHGQSLSGGPSAADGEPGFPNLTPTGIGHYSEDDFKRALRTGQRPGGGPALNELMPWKYFATLSDDQLHSIWLVLKSLPPKQFAEK